MRAVGTFGLRLAACVEQPSNASMIFGGGMARLCGGKIDHASRGNLVLCILMSSFTAALIAMSSASVVAPTTILCFFERQNMQFPCSRIIMHKTVFKSTEIEKGTSVKPSSNTPCPSAFQFGDSRLTASRMNELCKALGTRVISNVAYHPQTDGHTENFHRTLLSMLRGFFSKYRSNNWE